MNDNPIPPVTLQEVFGALVEVSSPYWVMHPGAVPEAGMMHSFPGRKKQKKNVYRPLA